MSDFNIKYGTMHQYMKTNIPEAYNYFVYFLLRRLVFSVCLVFLTMSPGPQLQIQVLMSLAQMCYAASYLPFLEPEDNYLELINEATVLIVTSILLAYPEGTLRPDHAT